MKIGTQTIRVIKVNMSTLAVLHSKDITLNSPGLPYYQGSDQQQMCVHKNGLLYVWDGQYIGTYDETTQTYNRQPEIFSGWLGPIAYDPGNTGTTLAPAHGERLILNASWHSVFFAELDPPNLKIHWRLVCPTYPTNSWGITRHVAVTGNGNWIIITAGTGSPSILNMWAAPNNSVDKGGSSSDVVQIINGSSPNIILGMTTRGDNEIIYLQLEGTDQVRLKSILIDDNGNITNNWTGDVISDFVPESSTITTGLQATDSKIYFGAKVYGEPWLVAVNPDGTSPSGSSLSKYLVGLVTT